MPYIYIKQLIAGKQITNWMLFNLLRLLHLIETSCADMDSNICQNYKTNGFDICGTQYRVWAKTHCPKFCGFCGMLKTSTKF